MRTAGLLRFLSAVPGEDIQRRAGRKENGAGAFAPAPLKFDFWWELVIPESQSFLGYRIEHLHVVHVEH